MLPHINGSVNIEVKFFLKDIQFLFTLTCKVHYIIIYNIHTKIYTK